jgi:hypothetical protein
MKSTSKEKEFLTTHREIPGRVNHWQQLEQRPTHNLWVNRIKAYSSVGFS